MQERDRCLRMNKMGMVGGSNSPYFEALSAYYEPASNEFGELDTTIQVTRRPGINPLAHLRQKQSTLI